MTWGHGRGQAAKNSDWKRQGYKLAWQELTMDARDEIKFSGLGLHTRQALFTIISVVGNYPDHHIRWQSSQDALLHLSFSIALLTQ